MLFANLMKDIGTQTEFKKLVSKLSDSDLEIIVSNAAYKDVKANKPGLRNVDVLQWCVNVIDSEIAKRCYDRAMKIL